MMGAMGHTEFVRSHARSPQGSPARPLNPPPPQPPVCAHVQLEFMAKFNLVDDVLTTSVLGDIYLSAAPEPAEGASLYKLSFEAFWEALVRAAIARFALNAVPDIDKVKALLQALYRGTAHVSHAWADGRAPDANTDAGGLIAGTKMLQMAFSAMWARDGGREYAEPPVTVRERGSEMLLRLGRSPPPT
jgi:hypothetical protein